MVVGGICSNAVAVPDHHGEESVQPQSKALDLCSHPHRWSRALRSDQMDMVVDTVEVLQHPEEAWSRAAVS